jgi:hypothetical protein
LTVISLMASSPPTCLFNRPETTNAMTDLDRHRHVAVAGDEDDRHVDPIDGDTLLQIELRLALAAKG